MQRLQITSLSLSSFFSTYSGPLRILRRSLLCGLIALTPVMIARGQITESTLQGRVTDPSAGVVVGAPVIARNAATGLTRTVNTGMDGTYTLASLAPGNYTIFVTVSGFKSFGRQDLTLNIGRTTQLDIKLEVG